jgi:PAS domain S-box-containing protein
VDTDKFYKSIAGLNTELSSLTKKANIENEQILKKSFVKYILIASFAAIFLLLLLMLVLNMSVFSPLKVLSKASDEISKGNLNVDLRVKADNEIGELAFSFQKMVEALKSSKFESTSYSAELEGSVTEKTRELNQILEEVKKDKLNLEKQRTATLNILEDVSQSQMDLKKANADLAAKSQELAALKSLSDEFVGVFDIFEAVMIANNYLIKFFGFTTLNYLVINPAEEGGIIYTTYLQEDVSEKYLRNAEKDLIDYLAALDIPALNSALNIIKSIVPKYIGQKLDNSLDFMPAEKLYFPLTIGDKNLGAIQVTSKDAAKISGEQKEFIKAIVLALSFSIDRLETLILAQHSKTVSLVESLTDGVVMFNSNKDVVLMNPAFAKYTGFSREYFNLSDLYKLLAGLSLQDMVNSAIMSGKTSHVNEVSLIKRFYEIFITPVRDNKGKIVGGAIIIHDITFLKEIDQMKTEFVSVASHQLRTPLTAIKLFTEMLVRGDVGKLNPEQQEYLENVNESTERMVSLVNDLLNVTRIESGRLAVNPQPVNVIKFIKNIIAEAKPLIVSRTQEIIFHENGFKLGTVPLDENLMRQVIHNLVVNAIRYSPEKNGLIEVSLNKYDDKNFIISVKDNGIGIPPEAQRRIFEKFYRADNAIKSITEGTGLGLYVSKMIVTSSGGKIWFESKKDKGTEFFVELPLSGMQEKKGERGLAIS